LRKQLSGLAVFLVLCEWKSACKGVTCIGADTPAPAITASAISSVVETVTPRPTLQPTGTPAAIPTSACSAFVYDNFAADFTTLQEPAAFRGKHYDQFDFLDAASGYAAEMLNDTYALEEVWQGSRRLEFLLRSVCRDDAGRSYFEIRDALVLNLAKSRSVARVCWVGGIPDSLILAIGIKDSSQPTQTLYDLGGGIFRRLDSAYRMDLEQERFTPIPTNGMECLEPFRGV